MKKTKKVTQTLNANHCRQTDTFQPRTQNKEMSKIKMIRQISDMTHLWTCREIDFSLPSCMNAP